MTTWKFKKSPRSEDIVISHTEEGQPEVILGRMRDIHFALMEVASYLKPNDIVITPNAVCITKGLEGESNN